MNQHILAVPEQGATPGQRPFKMRWVVQLFLMPVLYAVVLFLAAGHLVWFWGWLFITFYAVSSLIIFLVVRDPGLIAEREQSRAGAQAWDKRLLRVYALSSLLIVVVAGLQERFGWQPAMPLFLRLLSFIVLLGTAVTGTWAMKVNTFFSAYVRIQKERNHQVITAGPYGYIRHPGNLSMIGWALGGPLLLGSFWALLPAALATILVVWRTALEDRLLRAELTGYLAYTQSVPYRLLPGIW